jgi:cation/acetate symporter
MNPIVGYVSIALVVLSTVLIGFFGLRISRTTGDFYVASRTVRPWWNASAIGGEYLSAASVLGIAGLILLRGEQALWFPIGYTAGYLMLLFFVAAPLRRSGAYTIPDFTQARLESLTVRRVTSVLVLVIGWFYIVPQLQGAALTVGITTGLPRWIGAVAVAVIVGVVVAAGGMRSITFVQAFQFWLKLTALAIPVVVLLFALRGDGLPVEVALPTPAPVGPDAAYLTGSLLFALLLGTMGLPHVLVRFYTNPDGRAARRTTLIVLGLLSVFYLFPVAFGVLGRFFAPDLATPGEADALVLLLPGRLIPGVVGDLLTALVIAGAFGAFLSTSSGLVVSLAGVVSQELFGGSVRGFRVAAIGSALVPLVVALLTEPAGLAGSVGLVFAFTASTLCPVLVLGIWWRGLTARGAIAGMAVGAITCGGSILTAPWIDAGMLDPLLTQPAAWTVPLATAVVVLVSKADRARVPRGTDRFLARLHIPERTDAEPAKP